MIYGIFSFPFLYRIIIAFFVSFLFSLVLGKKFITLLKKGEMVDHFRSYSPSTHRAKKGTPTGGGILILLSLVVVFLLFGDLSNFYGIFALFATLSFGFAGFVDDLVKKRRKNSKGLSIKEKLLLQTFLCFCILILYFLLLKPSTWIYIPFIHFKLEMGIFYFLFAMFVILSSSNAVNLTDGLDGLAAGCMIAPAGVFTLFSLIHGSLECSSFFNLEYFPGSEELGFFWCVLAGAISGFLRYNRYPARMFMGGVGSESLGGALGMSAILLKKELLLLILGGVFVIEGLSVLLQVISYRLTGRRIFRMAPLHHHFELKGIGEVQIVRAFWLASFLFSFIAFLSFIFF